MPTIEVEQVSKKYTITHKKNGYLTLRDTIAEIAQKPFQKDKAKEDFWALKNISFSVEEGEAVGIIGSNGAGKSTLLKILSQITYPTTGKIILKGKVSSLLEVGTGFNQELTGRENIFLNGAILGMTKKEIHAKFDDIVGFAGIEKFLDTPVKHYSSGMYVRLAFAVVAHLETDILLVDEVLAVGDYEFQKKCLGKMDEVQKSNGRTILFVSHNLGAIQSLCHKCILLENGNLKNIGEPKIIVREYLNKNFNIAQSLNLRDIPRLEGLGEKIKISNCTLLNQTQQKTQTLLFGEQFSVEIEAIAQSDQYKLSLGLRIETNDGIMITGPLSQDSNVFFECRKDSHLRVRATFQSFILIPGYYWITLSIRQQGTIIDQIVCARNFTVSSGIYGNIKYHSGTWGYVYTSPLWQTV